MLCCNALKKNPKIWILYAGTLLSWPPAFAIIFAT